MVSIWTQEGGTILTIPQRHHLLGKVSPGLLPGDLKLAVCGIDLTFDSQMPWNVWHKESASKIFTGLSLTRSPVSGDSSGVFSITESASCLVLSPFTSDKGILPEITVLEAGETLEEGSVVPSQDRYILQCIGAQINHS